MLKQGKMPNSFLPIDAHIIEYSKIKSLIEQVPEELRRARKTGDVPYLPIQPKSYRKNWQYDDTAYNYIYDYLSAFTPFNFSDELQQVLDESRKEIITEYTQEQLFASLLHSATPANFRRFQSAELKDCFIKKVKGWSEAREGRNDRPNINQENVATKKEGKKEALEER